MIPLEERIKELQDKADSLDDKVPANLACILYHIECIIRGEDRDVSLNYLLDDIQEALEG